MKAKDKIARMEREKHSVVSYVRGYDGENICRFEKVYNSSSIAEQACKKLNLDQWGYRYVVECEFI